MRSYGLGLLCVSLNICQKVMICAFPLRNPWNKPQLAEHQLNNKLLVFENGLFFLGRHPNSKALLSTSSSSSSSDVVPPPIPKKRGRVNEIDFCMAPSDVSLSRYYAGYNDESETSERVDSDDLYSTENSGSTNAVSLTRALNNASNRAVRRILLSRSWPSAEALNLSLRQYLSSASPQTADSNTFTTKEKIELVAKNMGEEDQEALESSTKCPVPRPILNIIMRRRGDLNSIDSERKDDVLRSERVFRTNADAIPPQPIETSSSSRKKQGRSDKEWVNDQIFAFRESYGEVPGYELAEAYLECILSLATSGVESPKIVEVLAGGVYDESYKRFISVLKSVGTVFEELDATTELKGIEKGIKEETGPERIKLTQIAPKLVDKDICLSILDKISIKSEEEQKKDDVIGLVTNNEHPTNLNSNVTVLTKIDEGNESKIAVTTNKNENPDEIATEKVSKDTKRKDEKRSKNMSQVVKKGFKFPFFFMSRKKESKAIFISTSSETELSADPPGVEAGEILEPITTEIQPRDLGAVLLSAEEPSMTRQLNVLANIVQRALLFGGDQELLVLSETLEADKPAFIQRWYPDDAMNPSVSENALLEKQPGVQFLNCLVQLMKDCYGKGIVTSLEPPFYLIQSYRNAYERLIASLVELGSGYIKPLDRGRELILGTIPKTPQEEFGRFAEWEVNIRQTSPDVSAYPDDLIGEWEVQDEIGGKTIGVSTVILARQGEVLLKPPLTGLRWRLDPGPTHLDTCTFQFLSDDGDIFQYKGFIDRGARLESRFSKRPIQIRGAVTFQMRDGEAAYMSKAYKKDMLPLDVKTGTTRFVMTKSIETNKK